MTDAPVRSLTLVQQDGTICEILALEQRKLDLNIQRVRREVEEKWKDRGICISDSCASGISNVHILIGADYVNNFLLEKVVDGEVAWKTALGWVLSGPTRQDKQLNVDKSKIASVSFVQADIQRLWELEEMPGQHHSDLSYF